MTRRLQVLLSAWVVVTATCLVLSPHRAVGPVFVITREHGVHMSDVAVLLVAGAAVAITWQRR